MFATWTSLLTLAILAAGALAAPQTNLSKRVERRLRGTRPPQDKEDRVLKSALNVGNASHISYSSNWAGAVHTTVCKLLFHRIRLDL
jgi:hypothetical protein